MCQFDYNRYQKCGHKAIEIAGYCNEVFWKAGMTAHLVPCPEQNFRAFFIRIGNLNGMDFGSCKWVGQSGYCKICEEEYGVSAIICDFLVYSWARSQDRRTSSLHNYLSGMEYHESHTNCLQMPKAIPFRTYEDVKFLDGVGELVSPLFEVKLAGPIAYPPPSESMQYSSTFNDGVTKETLENLIAKSPSPPHEATPAIGENLLARRLRQHLPYIFTPYIKDTIAAMISVEDQDGAVLISIQDQDTPEEALDLGSTRELQTLYFPAKLQWYELNQGIDGVTKQWRSRGYYQSQVVEGSTPPSKYFWNHVGLTPADEQYVLNRLKDGIPLRIVWQEKFKERGTNLEMFHQYGRNLEQQIIEARGVRAGSRMAEIQRELGERSQTADGIQPFGIYQQNYVNNLQPVLRAATPQVNPFGQSLDDIIQQRLRHDQMRADFMQQLAVQQQMVRQQAIQDHRIREQRVRLQQYHQQLVLHEMMRQQEAQQEMRQLEQQQVQGQAGAGYFQKAPEVTVEEMRAEEGEQAEAL
ncbi:hypothetical protein NHQ30_002292 [Ciborinia camelliae]|nr:hypothetical protein NHQ30_002292 [Ciborinia camelliae]